MPYTINLAAGKYPIVYVRGFSPSAGQDTFYDAYYGFAETSVEKRDAPPTGPNGRPWYMQPDVFEGQLVRFLKEYGYVDAANAGLDLAPVTGLNPAQSIWVCRFYDQDVLQGKLRPIEDHAEDLRTLICDWIPQQLKDAGVNLGPNDADYKVILLAHSMGGLVCRCLLQNILPNAGKHSADLVHRFVTLATPHKGIEVGNAPGFLQDFLMGNLNLLDTDMFKEPRMRQYLNLPASVPLNSLGGYYPPGQCLCLIGSDWPDYAVGAGAVKSAIGSFSDGLVKQDRAYIDGAYFANVHRSHSGHRGIVNSFESYQNVRRFLFGDTKVTLSLENINLNIPKPLPNEQDFYDFEFSLSVRGTGVYLHQRRQNPCENAFRYDSQTIPTQIALHTGFLDTKLRRPDETFSYFSLAFRVSQHRLQRGWLFDHDYPDRVIYSETMEVRIGNAAPDNPTVQVDYRWLSDTVNPTDPASWQPATLTGGAFSFPLRAAQTLSATLRVIPSAW